MNDRIRRMVRTLFVVLAVAGGVVAASAAPAQACVLHDMRPHC